MGLKPLPTTFSRTREALHRVAEELVAPARKPDNEIALTVTPGGFGTPPFEHDGRRVRVMVDGPELVLESNGSERREPITSLAAGAAMIGAELFPRGAPEDTQPLAVDPEAARRLGDLYAIAGEALLEFRDELPEAAEASGINLWPEHFDIAFEAGAEAAGRRANYGVSPGDGEHPEPYAYVGPWTAEVEGELWNATGFNGAELGYADIVGAADPAAAIVGFFRARFETLS